MNLDETFTVLDCTAEQELEILLKMNQAGIVPELIWRIDNNLTVRFKKNDVSVAIRIMAEVIAPTE